jgi:hypothetical protein
VAELADSHATQARRQWLALRRASLPSANNRRFIPTHKENKHEAGRTKKFTEAQESKAAPYYEKVPSGEEIKGVTA